jgi:mannose-6-phosphate isomerase-like protein (cupin superfamily)
MTVHRIEKPWGCELLTAHTECYAGKILRVRAGYRLSLQHHRWKDETLYPLDGIVELERQTGECGLVPLPMTQEESYRIRPGERHRLIARTTARVLEVSTPELDDLVRWEGDYGRVRTILGSGAGKSIEHVRAMLGE